MSRSLGLTSVKWGILTDGKFWRLYEREDSKRLDTYYEIDLEDLILNGTPEDFKYFYLFFHSNAFPDFLDKVYKGSVDYAEEVGEELKENVYNALKYVSEGFLKTDTNNLSPENLKEIHDNSLILLYRLLFILYAEYRNLLPLGENALYTKSYSLHVLKKEIAGKVDDNEAFPFSTFHYWNKLKELFEIINHGNKELCVPPYNGGLFNPEKHPFLEKHRLGDVYIAKAINLLSRSSDRAFIDYGSLEIRHLGSIYEGLLEYKLEITEKDIYPFKEKGREIYIPLSEAQKPGRKIREDEIIRAGELFLVTDKGERKATGSYYTPDYIVKYIVENTIGPVVEDKKKKIAEKITKLKEKIKTSRGYNREAYKKELLKAESSLIQEILSLKILDPAMGSGHFLVEAVDFLAHELNRAMSGEPLEKAEISEVKEEITDYTQKESDEEDVRWARRAVVEKCIFGVDLNPLAVELAKLSLWLHTVAKNRPLNFLDHHLRCGNSLIGAKIEDLANFPELKKKRVEVSHRQLGLCERIFKEKVNILLGAFSQIERLPSDTVKQIIEKEKLYQDIRRFISRFQDVADIWTSVYFDYVINFDRLQQNLKENDEVWEGLRQETWFKKAKDIANKKRFFHWDIEFPEVFFEGHQRKENPGFDCVIGNPPYGIIFDAYSKKFFNKNYIAAEYQLESFTLFIERAISLLKWNGFHSYITPTTWLSMHYYENLRSLILSNNRLKQIIFFKEPVFEDATVENCVEIIERNKPGTESVLMLGVVGNKPESMNIKLEKMNKQRIEEFEGKRITEYLTPKSLDLFEKTQKICLPLRDITSLIVGCKPYQTGKGIPPQTKSIVENRIFDADFKKDDTYKPYIRGGDFYKYELNPQESRWISYGEWLAEPRPSAPFFAPKKIVIRQTADTIIATIDEKQYLNLNNVHNLILKVENNSLEFVLALLNSKLLSFLHTMIVPEFGRVFAEVKIVNLGKLPIPRISFTTPSDERKKLFESFVKLYLKDLDSL
jgi:type I restriction-modification system DNA methylase subunit